MRVAAEAALRIRPTRCWRL